MTFDFCRIYLMSDPMASRGFDRSMILSENQTVAVALARIFDGRLEVRGGELYFQGRHISNKNEIPRFAPDLSYSTGNFSRLREEHARLQLDSVNGTQDRLETVLARTRWPAEYFKGKLVLECGCGAGPDTEVLLNLGAQVVSVDIAGVDICKSNVGEHPDSLIVQASIDDLPFRSRAFDVVWCHRVLQHTPSPSAVLAHILSFVKDDGAVFVHSYARTLRQMLSWKYALRPVTSRINPELLYRMVRGWVPPLFWFTSSLRRMPPDLLGRVLFRIANHLLPIRNYRFEEKFSDKDDDYIVEYAIHDTFDCLSPRYDSPLGAREFRAIAQKHLKRAFEVWENPYVTLLRTLIAD